MTSSTTPPRRTERIVYTASTGAGRGVRVYVRDVRANPRMRTEHPEKERAVYRASGLWPIRSLAT